MDTTQFAQKIKQKYPEYANLNDQELVSKVVAKYPVYKSQITDYAEPKKQTFAQDALGDLKTIGTDILEGARKAADTVKEEVGKESSPEQTALRTIGAYAKAGANAIGAVGKGAVNAVLPENAEKQVTATIDKGITNAMEDPLVAATVEKTKAWYENLSDDQKKNVEALGGIAALASEFIGAGAGGRAANATKQVIQEGAEAVVDTTRRAAANTAKVVGEVTPGARRIVNEQVTKALDLTQGDVKNIAQSTGNEVGEFIADRNLIGGNKDETVKMIKDFYDTRYKTVREEIAKVGKEYNQVEVPRMRQALTEIQKQVGETPGLESVGSEVRDLLKKEVVTLEDVQRVKELMDDQFSLYKVTGDVKESTVKEGLANVRKEIKEFIEKEVQETTGTDIASLNNEVSTSRGILDAIDTRSTRGLTRSNIRMGDLATFGLVSSVGTPIAGAAAVFLKKAVETPAIRLKIARFFDRISDARRMKIQQTLESGKVPKELKVIADEAVNEPIELKNTSTIPSTVRDEMRKFVDYAQKSSKKADLELEEGASRIAEDYGIDISKAKTPKKIAAVFSKILDKN